MPTVTYDDVAVCIDGRRQLLLSGAVHYPRSTPGMWRRIFRESRAAGLNTVETYVFWNLHEHCKGRFDFSGRLDLPRFLRTAREEGLHVILRIGPYICAETNFGGLPPWLIHEPGMVTRTDNEPFRRCMEEWCRTLMARIGNLQATRGGPIILVQLENEYNNVARRYGDAGRRYADWVVGLAPRLGIEVPLVMCEGAAEGAIETLNGFSVAERVPDMHRQRPNQPILWTENWPGWYDTFGVARHRRDAREIAYNVIRFFAAGGTGVNYYMWHGGTNFGREAMYLQTPSYDFDGPVDEYGRLSDKGRHLGRLHAALLDRADLLLNCRPAVRAHTRAAAGGALPPAAIYRFSKAGRSLVFAVNSTGETLTLDAGGTRVTLQPRSAAVLTGERGVLNVVFESHTARAARPRRPAWRPTAVRLDFREFADSPPDRWPAGERCPIPLTVPESMLPYSRDLTDYGWYSTELRVGRAGERTLTLPMVRDFSTLFVNGRFAGMQPDRLEENVPSHWRHEYRVRLKAGANRIAVLAASFGLVKGDWMIDAPQSEEKKGLIGQMLLDGAPVKARWLLDVGLRGEHLRVSDPLPGAQQAWRPPGRSGARRLRWFRAEFGRLEPDAKGYALDIGRLHKGLAWLNGQCIGRYWQAPAAMIEEPWQAGFVELVGAGEPTQTRYHLPLEWLGARNVLVIFEETAAAPDGVCVVERE